MAFKSFGKTVERNPLSMYHSQIGGQAFLRGDFQKAVEEYTLSLQIESHEYEYFMRANSYEQFNEASKAESDYLKAYELNPNFYLPPFRLSMIYSRQNNIAEALHWIELAYRLKLLTDMPESFDSIFYGNISGTTFHVTRKAVASNFGNLLTQNGRHEEGLIYLDEAIGLDSNYENPYIAKVFALASLGRKTEVFDLIELMNRKNFRSAGAVSAEIGVMYPNL
jgi:tetratricopeptide (TPR) repeat protein